MSLFRFFKRKHTLNFSQLKSWINEQSKEISGRIQNETKTYFTKMKSEFQETHENIQNLQNAKLINQKIEERIKQIMNGNRDSYVQKVRALLENIHPPENHNLSSVNRFIREYEERIKIFSQSSAKPYYVVREFFGNETNKIARNIKKIDDQVKMVSRVITKYKDQMDNLDHIKNSLEKIKLSKLQSSEAANDKKNIQDEQKKLAAKRKLAEKEINKFMRSKGYEKFKLEKMEAQALNRKKESIHSILLNDFAIIERALRKYTKISLNNKLIDEYLENPIKALKNDKDFEIVNLLGKMESEVQKGHIVLKDKKKEKTIKKIAKLDKSYLKSLTKQSETLQSTEKELQMQIKKNESNLKLNELRNKLEYLTAREESLDRKKNKLDNFEEIDINLIKQNIKETMNKFNITLLD